ncbi:MAG: hypothetical protein Q9203_003757 [Teloschistes exilis]
MDSTTPADSTTPTDSTVSTDSTTPPDSISPKENWPNYATFVKALAPIDRNLQWLADFISQDAGPTSEGSLHVLEYDEDGIKDQAYSFDKLHSPPAAGSTRIVLLSHSNTWNLDRELLDRVALSLNLPPYFVSQHLHRTRYFQEHPSPHDPDNSTTKLPSASPWLEMWFMISLHLSAMVTFPASASAGATRTSSTIESIR